MGKEVSIIPCLDMQNGRVVKGDKFREAEEYHRLSYQKNDGKPYPHVYKKIL